VGVVVAWCVTLGVALLVADGVAVGRWVGVVVAVALGLDVGLALDAAVAVDVAPGLDVALALDAAVAVDVALALDAAVALEVGLSVAGPLLPDDGEGVRAAPPEAVPVETCGLGVETDGAVEECDPPLLQAATVTARSADPTAARPARSNAGRVAARRASAGGVRSGRTGAGRVATGRRAFMKPPRMTGGQWPRSTHLSMCHPNRQRKSERGNNSPPFRPAGIIPGADG